MLRLLPATYLSVDKGYGARKSISEAWKITEGKTLTILGKMIVIGLFGISGVILLFVGLIVTYPISMFLIVMFYRYLVKFDPEQIPEVIVKKSDKAEEKIEPKQEIV